jgi:hypothetical protein
MLVKLMNGGTPDHVGIIPQFLDIDDERPAAEQFNTKYSYGGGWSPMKPNKWLYDDKTHTIKYPGDPAYKPRACINFRDETIYVYDSAWVNIVQPDGSFSVSRMD